jgi:nicotinamidase-related amidase
VKLIRKSKPSAFSNPELNEYLKANDTQTIYAVGVFAEGCVRATVLEARRLAYNVTVPMDAIGTNANWKRTFALWSMRRAGVVLVPTLLTQEYEA